MPRRRRDSPIPRERAKIETAAAAALLGRDPERRAAVLRSFRWEHHPEIACTVLDALVTDAPPREQVETTRAVARWCDRAARDCCATCALTAVRERETEHGGDASPRPAPAEPSIPLDLYLAAVRAFKDRIDALERELGALRGVPPRTV